MHVLTRLLAVGWLGIIGVIGAAYAGVPAAVGPSLSLLNYGGGFVSPVSVLGGITVLWVLIDWRLGVIRVARENKAILLDKPGLARDPKGLARERKIRRKELKLQRLEEKALRAENRTEKKLAKDGRKENTLERNRERIAVKKESLRERQSLGRR